MSKFQDLNGMKFGRLTVIKRGENKNGRAMWVCQCECGNITKPIPGYKLKNGHTQSCGCFKKEVLSNKLKQQWQDEEFRQMKTNEMREKVKQFWQDEEFRQMKSNKMKELWEDEEFRQMKSNKAREQMKQQWQHEEFRQMKSNKMREMRYKGGITPISEHLRKLPVVIQWRKNTYEQAKYECQLTAKRVHGGNSDVHHLYGFNMIVLNAHKTYNIEIKEQVKDYTKEELKLLEEYIAGWHKDSSNAVVLCKEVHELFHSQYGYGNNTPEQFEEFKQRYINGEFNI